MTTASSQRPLKVAAAQIASIPGDVEENLRKHLDVVDAARSQGVEALVFPELSLTGHDGGAEALRVALPAVHAHVETLARAAGPLQVTVGLVEEAQGAQFYNTALTVRDGVVVHAHRKVNLATYGRLDDGKHFGAGSRIDTFAGRPPWRVSVLICADTWNPALVHLAALQGATLLLTPVSSACEAVGGDFDNPAGWDVNTAFHALTYGMAMVMANRVGSEGDLSFWGGSRVLDAHGRVLARADDRETLVVAELDYEHVRSARYRLPTVRDANLRLLRAELARVAREQASR